MSRSEPERRRAVRAVTDAPQRSMVTFALLLNFAGEIPQARYVGCPPRAPQDPARWSAS